MGLVFADACPETLAKSKKDARINELPEPEGDFVIGAKKRFTKQTDHSPSLGTAHG